MELVTYGPRGLKLELMFYSHCHLILSPAESSGIGVYG